MAVSLGIVAVVFTSINLLTTNLAYADDQTQIGARSDGSACSTFLGMTNWDCGFLQFENGVKTPQETLTHNIVVIATNVLTDITVIAAYLVLAYVIYGGYLYMFSSGDPGKAASGKKALTHAFIGLAIVMSAYTIFGAIRIAILGNNSFSGCNPLSGTECIDGNAMVTNLIQWFIGMAGVVSAIFIVVGGWGYITASGDPNKLQKAKTTLLYAIIGLIIVALAEVLTAFVSNLVRESNTFNGYIEPPAKIITNINKEDIS